MRRFLVIGFILVLLIAAPIVAYLLINQNTNNQSHANPSSSLLFEDITTPVVVGQAFKAIVDVNPSSSGTSNSVSFVKVTVSYDGSKLKTDNGSLVPSAAFPVTLEGPTNTCSGTSCTITATLSIGPDPTKAVTSQTAVATITFTPLAATDANAPITLNFVTGQNQILSLASTDQPAENVFTQGIPASITIVTSDSLSGTPEPTSGGTDNGVPTDTPVPTGTTPGNTTPTNQPPVCNTLTLTPLASDSSGLSYSYTTAGTDSDGTISKVTFNFGDGNVQDDTDGSTIGTNSVNESESHTYASAGTYTASALLTDDQGAISTTSTCKQTITIGGAPTPTPTPVFIATGGTPTPTPIPANPQKIPPTGPGNTILIIGLTGAALVGVGFFFLMGF